jgi:hypothetical protein
MRAWEMCAWRERDRRLPDWVKSVSKTLWLTPEFAFLKLETISRGKKGAKHTPTCTQLYACVDKNVAAPGANGCPIMAHFQISSVSSLTQCTL